VESPFSSISCKSTCQCRQARLGTSSTPASCGVAPYKTKCQSFALFARQDFGLQCGNFCLLLTYSLCGAGHQSTPCKATFSAHSLVLRGRISIHRLASDILCSLVAAWQDIDLRRGKPLFLNEERYAALTKLVASSGIDHDSQVLALTVRRLPQTAD
jgi:hypothetical protein